MADDRAPGAPNDTGSRPDGGGAAPMEPMPGPAPGAQAPGTRDPAAEPAPSRPAPDSVQAVAPSGERQCPWCSVDLGTSSAVRCPSCGAVLVEDPEASVPGVTAIDPEAVRRAASWERVRQGASIRDLFEPSPGEAAESGVQPSSMEALDPPSTEIRLEMARIRAELEAAAEREAGEPTGVDADAGSSGAMAGTEPPATPDPEAPSS